MKIQIKKTGTNTFGSWACFNAIINSNCIISGIAKVDELTELEENKTYDDLYLICKVRSGKTYYRIMKNNL